MPTVLVVANETIGGARTFLELWPLLTVRTSVRELRTNMALESIGWLQTRVYSRTERAPR